MPLCKPTRRIVIGDVTIGGGHPIVLQSMCAVKTTDVEAAVAQVELLRKAGAGIIRLAVDSKRDAEAIKEIRKRTEATLSVDLQENYRVASEIAPHCDKIRYNPGHLHHAETGRDWREKVRFLADTAAEHDCAIRVGVNCGSVDPRMKERFEEGDRIGPMLASAVEHAAFLDSIGFTRYCVSLKDSDPVLVQAANRRFAAEMPMVPLHLGVTEAGMPPEGILKSRIAMEPLLAEGIGDTLRVSLTVPAERKCEEVEAGRLILTNVEAGQIIDAAAWNPNRLNIISCPSCARVQNADFVKLAEKVREITAYAAEYPVTIAVMGCRVNGPGETDEADLGLWCGPREVNLKRGEQLVGAFSFEEVLVRLKGELDGIIGGMGGGRRGLD